MKKILGINFPSRLTKWFASEANLKLTERFSETNWSKFIKIGQKVKSIYEANFKQIWNAFEGNLSIQKEDSEFITAANLNKLLKKINKILKPLVKLHSYI